MKTLAIILSAIALTSCGIPLRIVTSYEDPDTGLTFSGAYSSKSGLQIEARK
jgi:hypothetical protein